MPSVPQSSNSQKINHFFLMFLFDYLKNKKKEKILFIWLPKKDYLMLLN